MGRRGWLWAGLLEHTHTQVRHYGSVIGTQAGKNTHTHAHTAATLAQVRRYVFKHDGSAVDKLSLSIDYVNCDKIREETISQLDKQWQVVHSVI